MASVITTEMPVSARSRYAANLYFRDGVALSATLASLLYLLLAVSLDAAGYVESLAVLVPVTIAALVVGFLMSYSRFDAFFSLSHSMFTGLAVILFLLSGLVHQAEIAPFVSNGIPELQARAYFVLLRGLEWLDAAFRGQANANNYWFMIEMCFLVWWLTYLGIWSVFRYGYTWRAVVPAGIILVINAYYAPNSILGFLIVFCLIALMLLVRTNLAELQQRWREQRVYYTQDITLDFLRNGLLYGAIVLALAWLVPGLGRNTQVRTVLAPINQQWEETARWWNRLNEGLKRRPGQTGAAFGSQLSLGGARVVDDKILFTVTAPVGRYWRATVYDTYTGREWVNSAKEEREFAAQEFTPSMGWAMRLPLTQTVTVMAPIGNMIFAAQDIERVSLSFSSIVRPVPGIAAPPTSGMPAGSGMPATEADLVEIAMAWVPAGLETGQSYEVVSNYTNVTAQALAAAGTVYPEEIKETFLQLPPDFSERVAAEARTITAGMTNVYDQAKAIEAYLRQIPYNDAIDAPPADRDPVEYFLYDIRQGYCDYYATSMAVMLRSLGVPARVVSGYAEGTLEEDYTGYVIRARDAHTWVEVYFPTYGWIEFEPTGAESPLVRPDATETSADGSEAETLGAAGSAITNTLNGPLEDDMAAMQALDGELAAGSASLAGRTWWVWGLLTPVAAVLGVWLVWRARASGPTGFDPDLPPILFDRLQRWAGRIGVQSPASETPYEQARALGRFIPEGRASISAITQSYVRYRFRPHPGDPPHVPVDAQAGPRLFGAWKELEPVLWRAWLRKIMRRPGPNRDPYALLRD